MFWILGLLSLLMLAFLGGVACATWALKKLSPEAFKLAVQKLRDEDMAKYDKILKEDDPQ
jgi:hypothetical protein